MANQKSALELLKLVEAKITSLRSLTAEVVGFRMRTYLDASKNSHARFEGILRLARPNFAELRYISGSRKVVAVADGKSFWQWESGAREYTKMSPGPQGHSIVLADSLPIGWPVELFFTRHVPHLDVPATLTSQGKFQVIEFHEAPDARQRIFIGPDKLVHKFRSELLGGRYIGEWELKNIKLDAATRPAPFAFTPPPGTREFAVPKPPELLKPGTHAPDFTVENREGKPLRLTDLAGKVVVLDFWAVSCGPCLEAFPHNNTVAKKFGDDVIFLALHCQDTKENFQRWLAKYPQYDALHYAVDTAPPGQDVGTRLYKIFGQPTVYVIGKDGKITKTFVGFSGPTPALESAILAAGGTRR